MVFTGMVLLAHLAVANEFVADVLQRESERRLALLVCLLWAGARIVPLTDEGPLSFPPPFAELGN